MSQSTLAIELPELKERIGHRLRYGRNPSAWSAAQAANVDAILRTGMRLACNPPPVSVAGTQTPVQHSWSWMLPTIAYDAWITREPASGATVVSNGDTPAVLTGGGTTAFLDPAMAGKTISVYTNDANETLVSSKTVARVDSSTQLVLEEGQTIAAGTYRWGMVADGNYRLPDDWAGFDGTSLKFGAGLSDVAVKIVGEHQILSLRQRTSATFTGQPAYLATRPVSGTGSEGPQKFEMLVYPNPNVDYVLYGKQLRSIDALSSVLRHVPGGMQYARLFELACYAAGEHEIDDNPGGPDYQAFLAVLSQCVTLDQQAHTPRIVGVIRTPKPALISEHGNSSVTLYNGMEIPE